MLDKINVQHKSAIKLRLKLILMLEKNVIRIVSVFACIYKHFF